MWNKLKVAWENFSAENGNLKAAALSFYGFTTVLPLLLLAVTILAFVVGSSQRAFTTVSGFFSTLAPTSSAMIRSVLGGIVRARGTIALFSILALVWTSSQIFVVMQQLFNAIWEVKRKPGFIHREVKAIALLIGLGALFVLSVAATSVVSYLSSSALLGRTLSGAGAVASVVGSLLVASIFDVALFTLIYRFVPDTRTSWRAALFGGIIGGIAWEVTKQAYRVYLQHFNHYDALYGSLGGVIILVLWIYYSSMILVFGAELAYADETVGMERHEEAEPVRKSA